MSKKIFGPNDTGDIIVVNDPRWNYLIFLDELNNQHLEMKRILFVKPSEKPIHFSFFEQSIQISTGSKASYPF